MAESSKQKPCGCGCLPPPKKAAKAPRPDVKNSKK
jgi:hypothetical protein